MWKLGPRWTDEARLAAEWSAARPFPHLVFDDVVGEAAMSELLAILEEEPVETFASEVYLFDASTPEPRTEGMRRLRESFAATFAPPLERITGKTLRRADMRAYAYREGHHLLPHSDHQEGVGRALAFAYYAPSPEPPAGGELEMFRCETDAAGEIVATVSEAIIEPKPDRLVVFEVGDLSLHQVREVTTGLRVSLSGWFYP
jgi:Rps23 Pro-64 3,4-dihydroxylase Tpa1-like proline 4-hydroxylase